MGMGTYRIIKQNLVSSRDIVKVAPLLRPLVMGLFCVGQSAGIFVAAACFSICSEYLDGVVVLFSDYDTSPEGTKSEWMKIRRISKASLVGIVMVLVELLRRISFERGWAVAGDDRWPNCCGDPSSGEPDAWAKRG
ncbi:hypothetical protein AVEN_205964-1 [Araneus ventricosus]|uniref:Uncharacterized protein n=1 Tax=Araneus ventricosus TaxID=182803 RepID=A0A4Y2TSV1_ARAVE|nr:hypothetical protein AVEN_205964-1 [Araneus ventricosus]